VFKNDTVSLSGTVWSGTGKEGNEMEKTWHFGCDRKTPRLENL